MADYYSFLVTTTNFQVDDPDAFEKELQQLGVVPDNWDSGLTYTRERGEFWLGGYDASTTVCSGEDDDEVDIIPIVQKHMRNDSIWTLQSVGYEKLRSVTGYAGVVTKTAVKFRNLDDVEEELKVQVLVVKNLRVKLLNRAGKQRRKPKANKHQHLQGGSDIERT